MGSPQGLNLYPYVMDNPLRYVDPDGQEHWWYDKSKGAYVLRPGNGDPNDRDVLRQREQVTAGVAGRYGTNGVKAKVGDQLILVPGGTALRKLPLSKPPVQTNRKPAAPKKSREEYDAEDRFIREKKKADAILGWSFVENEAEVFFWATAGLAGGEIAGIAGSWLAKNAPLLFDSGITTLSGTAANPGVIEKAINAVPLLWDSGITTLFSNRVPSGPAPRSLGAGASTQRSLPSGERLSLPPGPTRTELPPGSPEPPLLRRSNGYRVSPEGQVYEPTPEANLGEGGIGASEGAQRVHDFHVGTGTSSNPQVSWGRNIAYAEGEVDGVTLRAGENWAVSGPDYPGSISTVPESERVFETLVANHPRGLDSEVKLLEQLARQLTPQSRGNIYLYSERVLCDSCTFVIKQFRARFPNVNLIVTSP